MKFKNENFNIELKDNTLFFLGSMELENYSEVKNFLSKVDSSLNVNELSIDISKLSFLNSSGIRTLAIFLMGSTKIFKICINPNKTWQRAGIPPLIHIRKKGEISIIN